MTDSKIEVVNGDSGTTDGGDEGAVTVPEHDPYYEPIVSLPEVHVPTHEEEEDEMIKIRAKLYRYDSSVTPHEWKERGTGDIKLLRHRTNEASIRVVMRRDKTLKICANHFIAPWMNLKPKSGSDNAFVWSVHADYVEEEPRPELLAIKFANAENAKKWNDAFKEAQELVKQAIAKQPPSEQLLSMLSSLSGLEGQGSSSSEVESDEEEEEGNSSKDTPEKSTGDSGKKSDGGSAVVEEIAKLSIEEQSEPVASKV